MRIVLQASTHAYQAGIVEHGSKKFMSNASKIGWAMFNSSYHIDIMNGMIIRSVMLTFGMNIRPRRSGFHLIVRIVARRKFGFSRFRLISSNQLASRSLVSAVDWRWGGRSQRSVIWSEPFLRACLSNGETHLLIDYMEKYYRHTNKRTHVTSAIIYQHSRMDLVMVSSSNCNTVNLDVFVCDDCYVTYQPR